MKEVKPLTLTRAGLLGSLGVLVVAATCVWLGFWQLRRLEEKRALNAAVAERAALPPLPLGVAPADTTGLLLRQVTIEGEYDNAHSFVVAGRSHRGIPGVHLYSPLRLAGGRGVVLVNRGWVPSPDAATIDLEEHAVAGPVTVVGLAMPFPEEEDRAARRAAEEVDGPAVSVPGDVAAGGAVQGAAAGGEAGFRRVWYHLDRPELAARLPYAVPELYVQALPRDASQDVPLPLPIPELDEGSHLSYAIQWFSFAAIFIIGWIAILARRGSKEATTAPPMPSRPSRPPPSPSRRPPPPPGPGSGSGGGKPEGGGWTPGLVLAVAAGVTAAAVAAAACDDAVGPRPTPNLTLELLPERVPKLGWPGDTVRLEARVLAPSGQTLPELAVLWRSESPLVATVDQDGLVTAVSHGETTIEASVAGAKAFATVVVDTTITVSLTITGVPAAVRQGDVIRLGATVRSRDPDVSDPTGVRWKVIDETHGAIDADGRLVPYAPGVARVVASLEVWTDTVEIAVQHRGLLGSFGIVGRGAVASRYTSDLWVTADHAYTGTWSCRGGIGESVCGNALFAWDVRNPAAPVLTDSVIVTAATVNDVKISPDGSFAVLTQEFAQLGNGITIMDLADPGHPQVVTHYTAGLQNGVHNVWIDGHYVYAVHNGYGGLVILDVSALDAPVEVARFYAGSSFVHDVYVRDGLAFVSHWDEGLIILDVGNGIAQGSPENPREVSRVRTETGYVHNAWWWPEAGYVFIGEEFFGSQFASPGRMRVIDVRDLTRPVEVASFFLPGYPPHNFWMDEEREILFAAWYGNGLRAIDVSGELMGDLHRQGREIAAILPIPPAGGPAPAAAVSGATYWLDVSGVRTAGRGPWSLDGMTDELAQAQARQPAHGPALGLGDGRAHGLAHGPVGHAMELDPLDYRPCHAAAVAATSGNQNGIPGTGTAVWAPQIHDGHIFASDMNAGLWVLRFDAP